MSDIELNWFKQEKTGFDDFFARDKAQLSNRNCMTCNS